MHSCNICRSTTTTPSVLLKQIFHSQAIGVYNIIILNKFSMVHYNRNGKHSTCKQLLVELIFVLNTYTVDSPAEEHKKLYLYSYVYSMYMYMHSCWLIEPICINYNYELLKAIKPSTHVNVYSTLACMHVYQTCNAN